MTFESSLYFSDDESLYRYDEETDSFILEMK